MEFENWCLTHGLKLPNRITDRQAILASSDMLSRIGAMCREYEQELKFLVEARISPLKEELIFKSLPVEVSEIRRCIMEVWQIIDDAQYIESALADLEKQKAEEAEGKSEEDNSQNESGSL